MFKRLWQRIRLELSRDQLDLKWYLFKMDHYLDEHGCPQPDQAPPNIFVFAYTVLVDLALVLRCEATDHDWQDNSSAGPDSGDMDMYCPRCGQHFHHQLY